MSFSAEIWLPPMMPPAKGKQMVAGCSPSVREERGTARDPAREVASFASCGEKAEVMWPASMMFALYENAVAANLASRLQHPMCNRSEEHTSELQSLMRISY